MYVCMYVCVYVCMYACMHTCMRAYMHVCMYVFAIDVNDLLWVNLKYYFTTIILHLTDVLYRKIVCVVRTESVTSPFDVQ